MARILAALALIACGVAIFALVSGSLSGAEEDDAKGAKERKSRSEQIEQQTTTAETYTVVAGDTLSGIADKAGVSLSKLRKLNPDLDAESLNAGQVIQLRES